MIGDCSAAPVLIQQGWGRSCFSTGVVVCDGEDGQRDGRRTESKIQAGKTMQLLKTGSAYPKYPSARDWEHV